MCVCAGGGGGGGQKENACVGGEADFMLTVHMGSTSRSSGI